MKISAKNLMDSLSSELSPIYLLMAQETFQIQELVDKICTQAKKENFLERQSFYISKGTDWSFLKSSEENLDLFGSKKIIEIKLIDSGPGNKGAKALKTYSEEPDISKIVIVSAERLDKKSQDAVWVKTLEAAGKLIIVNPLTKNALPKWIQDKGKDFDLEIENEACQILAEKTEGNLLASLQEIRKLSLLFPQQTINYENMISSISDSAKYNIFDLSNAFITGNRERTATILESLKEEGTPETLILWALSKEINNLFKTKNKGSAQGIWGPRNYLDSLESLSKQIPISRIKEALKLVAEIDSGIKGYSKENPWQSIRQLIIDFKFA
jgi:DNA polymerase-3 subunit delta|tara:strand:- start:7880 stop:8860 length:981 start_codon:yes stop_codon:yes gene_type:complete